MDKQGAHGGIDSPAQTEQHVLPAHRLSDLLNQILGIPLHRPVRLYVGKQNLVQVG